MLGISTNHKLQTTRCTMGLCRWILAGLFAVLALAPENSKTISSQNLERSADLCELLRDEQEDLLNEYPNEYYDCHAHSRYLKLSNKNHVDLFKPS